MYFDFMHGLSVDTRKKTNRESARIRPSGEANRICGLFHLMCPHPEIPFPNWINTNTA